MALMKAELTIHCKIPFPNKTTEHTYSVGGVLLCYTNPIPIFFIAGPLCNSVMFVKEIGFWREGFVQLSSAKSWLGMFTFAGISTMTVASEMYVYPVPRALSRTRASN